jgi:hypothetical protein
LSKTAVISDNHRAVVFTVSTISKVLPVQQHLLGVEYTADSTVSIRTRSKCHCHVQLQYSTVIDT